MKDIKERRKKGLLKKLSEIEGLFSSVLTSVWDYIDDDNRKKVSASERLFNELKLMIAEKP